ncbi:MAG: rod shape-determining protein MreC [Actinomycetota bacterium]|nr:rod shape-determining protein MreC [Actinomycetota bacterium]
MAPSRKSVKNIIILAIIVILCLIIIAASFRDSDAVKSLRESTLDFFKPVQEKLYAFFQPLIRTFNNIKNFFGLSSRIKELEQENAELLGNYSENINLRIENDSLRSLLEIKQRENYKTVAAKVIGYNTDKWQSEIILNVGKNEGVLEGMCVINEKGLVGMVILSASNSCNVRLLNDPQTSLGARILSSRSLGMIQGSKNNTILFNYISKSDIVYTGDILITAEFGKYIPDEILIGAIKKVNISDNNPYQEIEVETFVDMRKIENVLVITGW